METLAFVGFDTLSDLSLSVRREDVLRVYSGRTGCMCGCRGRYYTTSTCREADTEVSDAQVTRVLRTLAASASAVEVDVGLYGETIAYLETGTRVFAAYLRAGSPVFGGTVRS